MESQKPDEAARAREQEAAQRKQEEVKRQEAQRRETQRQREQAGDEDENRREGGGAKYRLMSVHMIDGETLPVGAEIGADTDRPYDATPSNQMMGLNEEGKRRVNEVHQKLYGKDAPWHDDRLYRAQEEARRSEQEQRQQEEEAAPVSYAQAHEQGKEWQGKPATLPPHLARPTPQSLTKGGDTSQLMGPATADQDINNPDVAVRTTRPNEEQLPKNS